LGNKWATAESVAAARAASIAAATSSKLVAEQVTVEVDSHRRRLCPSICRLDAGEHEIVRSFLAGHELAAHDGDRGEDDLVLTAE
jgi:hypothetical protein